MPFGFHAPELIIVLVVALLVLGPKRLPEMGSAVGKTFKAFQQSMKDITDSAQSPLLTEPTSTALAPSPLLPAPDAQVSRKLLSVETDDVRQVVASPSPTPTETVS